MTKCPASLHVTQESCKNQGNFKCSNHSSRQILVIYNYFVNLFVFDSLFTSHSTIYFGHVGDGT